jgi:hypothetical protein
MKQMNCPKGHGAMEPQKKQRTVPFRGIEIRITEHAFVCPVCQLTAGTVESAGKIQQTIAASNSEIPMPDWQKRELKKRYEEYNQGRLELHDWKSVHKGLRNKYK